VLLTAGYSQYLNADPLSGPQTSLPLATFKLVTSGQPNYIARGYGAAALLMSLVLILFLAARAVGGRGPGQLSARQRRARALASARIAGRFAPADHVPDALAPDPSDPGAFDRDAFNPGEYDEPDTTEHDA
jgi:phosphate transport system permease protein